MNNRILIAAALWVGLSHAAFAGGKTWNYIWVSPIADPAAKSPFWVEQGNATDTLSGRSFEIQIGGKAGLVLCDLKGTIRGQTVTATLRDLDADETPTHFTGRFVTKAATDRISLIGPDGTAIVLYAPAEKSN